MTAALLGTGDPRKSPVPREPPAGTPLLRFARTASALASPAPASTEEPPTREDSPTLSAQQDAVGVLQAGHPGERVAQRPATEGAQEHQRVLASALHMLVHFYSRGWRLQSSDSCFSSSEDWLHLPWWLHAQAVEEHLREQEAAMS